jgi:hypothetical protein
VSILPRLLEIVLPSGGYALLSVEAYFDESGTHDQSSVLCFAGFVIRDDQARAMDAGWAQMLTRYKLPYFHMVDCAHGVGVFRELNRSARIAVETEAIALMRSHIAQCFVNSVNPVTFEQEVPTHPQIGSAYSLLAHSCLASVANWATEHGFRGDVAYFFENGHRNQNEANAIMQMIFSQPELRTRHHYASHTFAAKEKLPLLQAADIIAWLWNKECRRVLSEGGIRKKREDLTALLQPVNGDEPFCIGVHWDFAKLRKITGPVMRNEYPITYPWRD